MVGGCNGGWWILFDKIFFMLNSENCGDLLPSHELLHLMFPRGYGEDDLSITMHESFMQCSICPIDRQLMVMKPGLYIENYMNDVVGNLFLAWPGTGTRFSMFVYVR